MRRPVIAIVLIALTVAACSPETTPPDPVAASPTGDVDRWRTDPDEPYPFVTPIPPDAPTPVDGRYTRSLTASQVGAQGHCVRCPPYKLDPGPASITLRGGRLLLEHPAAGFRARAHYVVEGDRLVFFNDPNCPRTRGVYRWSLEEESLRLEVVEDDCAFDLLRARYLSAGPWAAES